MPDQSSPAQPLGPKNEQGIMEVPINIVGSNKYGRYKKISVEQTFNMIISDGFLVDYAGYKVVLDLTKDPTSLGRGIFSSVVNNFMIVVISGAVFVVKPSLSFFAIGALTTSEGEVYISENNAGQIALSDGENIYIYNPSTSVFTIAVTPFVPGFLSFQNTRFICAAIGTNEWWLSKENDGTVWVFGSATVGELQTKPDFVQAAIPMPGRGNMLFVMGYTVTEQWNDTGAALFPYLRTTSFNIDYGCINPSSIAYQGDFIVWVGVSEEAGAVIMYTDGGKLYEISTDGIDFLLSQLTKPQDCTGFLLKLDGHLIYQVTFITDNLTLLYDFTTKLFFTATDENLNYHIARKIVYFNDAYYFVSLNDGLVYEFGTIYTNYDYSPTNEPLTEVKAIPRIRYTAPIRLSSQRFFVCKSLGFTLEQGETNFFIPNPGEDLIMITETGIPMEDETATYNMITDTAFPFNGNDPYAPPYNTSISNMRVDLSISRDGGYTFGNTISQNLNPTGNRINRMIFQRLGRANDVTFQLQFWGLSEFVVTDGLVELYV